jgi:hypothetical protein
MFAQETEAQNSHGLFVLYPIPEFHTHNLTLEAEEVFLNHTSPVIRQGCEADKITQHRRRSWVEWNSEENMDRQGNREVLVRGFSPQRSPNCKNHDVWVRLYIGI